MSIFFLLLPSPPFMSPPPFMIYERIGEPKKHSPLREVKKKQKNILMDLVQLTRKPPPAPPKCGLCFFSHHCFIILFQFLDIFFTLKVKQIREKWIRTETPPPPLWIKSIIFFFFFFFFFFFLTSLREAFKSKKYTELWFFTKPSRPPPPMQTLAQNQIFKHLKYSL